MGKCLVTTYKGIIDNPNLFKQGEVKFGIPSGVTLTINTKGATAKLQAGSIDGMIINVDKDLALSEWNNFPSSSDDTILSIIDRKAITNLNSVTSSKAKKIKLYGYSGIFDKMNITSLTKIYFDCDYKSFGYMPQIHSLGESVNYVHLYNLNWDNFDIAHLPLLKETAINTGEYYPVSNYGKHIGLEYINIQGSLASGSIESLAQESVKNGRKEGTLKIVCNSINNGTTWKGQPTSYLQTLYIKFGDSYEGGYEITDTNPV